MLFLLLVQFGWLGGAQGQKIRLKSVERLTAADRLAVMESLKKDDDAWDDAVGLPKKFIPSTANHYHSARLNQTLHPLRDAANYASRLLDSNDPAYRQRAFRVIERLLSRQDGDPASPTFGVWPYYDEESLKQMAAPDYNWADFIGVALLEDYLNHGDVLPTELREAMKKGILQAAKAIVKRDVKPGYTNIAIMGTFVTYVASHLFDLPEMQAYADMRLKRFYDFTMNLNGFAEYNSPTYTRVALNELARMKKYLLDPEALRMTEACYRLGWQGLAAHFHPPTGQLAGPHSRSYSTLLRSDFYPFLASASQGQGVYGTIPKIASDYRLPHRIPAELVGRFRVLSQPAVTIDTFGLGQNSPVGYTYLRPEYCLGTVSRGTLWEQSRPFIAYWGTVEQPRYLRVRLLHDFVDFCAGNLFTAQKEGQTLSGLCLATNGGDYHPSLDRLKDGRFEAADLRLRFEISDPRLLEKLTLDGPAFSFTDDRVSVRVKMLQAKFGDYAIRVEKGQDAKTSYVDWIIHAGAKRAFNLTELAEVLFAWATAFSTSPVPETALTTTQLVPEAGAATLRWGDLTLRVPAKPDTEAQLQAVGNPSLTK
ncbi:MAG: hypothetical protein LH606_07065 [Cytophagaceae bacterium]|nr:hypothetical protein [Cytophagaceae bacterium]